MGQVLSTSLLLHTPTFLECSASLKQQETQLRLMTTNN